MNKASLIGRLTREPEVRTTQSGKSVCTFSLAVPFFGGESRDGAGADFITCVAWESKAETIYRYCKKGSQIGVSGKLRSRRYEVRGEPRYATEVYVDEITFCSGCGREAVQKEAPDYASGDFEEVYGADEDLPF